MRWLVAWLKSFRGSARSQPLEDAQERRSEILRLLRQAEDRGDSREIGRLRMILAAATHAELAEVVWQ